MSCSGKVGHGQGWTQARGRAREWLGQVGHVSGSVGRAREWLGDPGTGAKCKGGVGG